MGITKTFKNFALKHLWVDTAVHIGLGFLNEHNLSNRYNNEEGGGGITDNARYCYSVWMRHLIKTCRCADAAFPKTVAEFGPGNSIGCGLTALLCGCEHYYGFDIREYNELSEQEAILDKIIEMLKNREPVPNDNDFSNIKPSLSSYDFPFDILTDDLLEKSLSEERISIIREDLHKTNNSERKMITYIAPWNEKNVEDFKCDYVFSQAVMEHIDEIENAYNFMYKVLGDGCVMSHQIDFKSHSSSPYWNRQWGYSDRAWELVSKSHLFLINRQPLSVHLSLADKSGFKLLTLDKAIPPAEKISLSRKQLSKRYKNLSDEDMTTSGAFAVWKKDI